jgi:hypothetical protein
MFDRTENEASLIDRFCVMAILRRSVTGVPLWIDIGSTFLVLTPTGNPSLIWMSKPVDSENPASVLPSQRLLRFMKKEKVKDEWISFHEGRGRKPRYLRRGLSANTAAG